MFRRLFQPKWQHPKRDVRLDAVKRLDPCLGEDHQRLLELAHRDPEVDVRAAAAARLMDMQLLDELCQSDAAELQTAARQRLLELLCGEVTGGPDTEPRLTRIAALDEPQMLRRIIEAGDEPARLAALGRITDEALLEAVAMDNTMASVRATAAEQLQDRARLERVAAQARNKDKRTYQISRAKLRQRQAQAQEQQEQQRLSRELCEAVERHSRARQSPFYEQQLQQLLQRWESLSIAPDEGLRQRFEQAVKNCNQLLAEQKDEAAARETARACAAQRQACCEALEQQLQQLQLTAAQSNEAIELIEASLNEQTSLWQQADDPLPADEQAQARFDKARQRLQRYQAAAQRVLQGQAQLESLASQVAQLRLPEQGKQLQRFENELKQQLAQIDWPTGIAPPDSVAAAQAALTAVAQKDQDYRQWQRQQRPVLTKGLEQFATALDQGDLARADQHFAELQRLMDRLPAKDSAPHQPRFKQLRARLWELRDWRGFAATQQQETLCERMEALRDSDIDPQEKATQIKQLQAAWKALGPGDAQTSQALWERFKLAADQAYEPVREHHHAQRQQRQDNLVQRRHICDQLQAYLDGVNWSDVDWKHLERVLRTASKEWRQYSPVERKPGRPLQQRFDELTQQLQAKLTEERGRNAAAKQALVQRAEALVEHPDLNEAIQQAKQLQARWKEIGITARREDRKYWQAFRAACDAIFARLEQQRQAESSQQRANQEIAERLCSQIRTLGETSDQKLAATHSEFEQLWMEFQALGPLPKRSAKGLEKRFRQACEAYERRLAGLESRQAHARQEQMLHRARLCERLEAAAVTPGTTDDEMATQDDTTALPADVQACLTQRQALAQQAIADRDPQPLKDQWSHNLETKQRLCIQMEILADIESPPEAKDARMAYQLAQLTNGKAHTPTDPAAKTTLAHDLLRQWCCCGAVPPEEQTGLSQRFETALQALPKGDSKGDGGII